MVDIIDRFRRCVSGQEAKSVLGEIAKTLVMLALSLAFAVAVILVAGKGSFETVRVFLTSPFEDSYTLSRVLTESIPLMFTGVAVSIMSRAGQFNMFVEGGFFVGAFVAVFASYGVLSALIFMMRPCGERYGYIHGITYDSST